MTLGLLDDTTHNVRNLYALSFVNTPCITAVSTSYSVTTLMTCSIYLTTEHPGRTDDHDLWAPLMYPLLIGSTGTLCRILLHNLRIT